MMVHVYNSIDWYDLVQHLDADRLLPDDVAARYWVTCVRLAGVDGWAMRLLQQFLYWHW
ncbi:hypothetical protein ACNKHU_05220 [Shigella flexneri]